MADNELNGGVASISLSSGADATVSSSEPASKPLDASQPAPNVADDFVDPWNVVSNSETGVDYDKLISKI